MNNHSLATHTPLPFYRYYDKNLAKLKDTLEDFMEGIIISNIRKIPGRLPLGNTQENQHTQGPINNNKKKLTAEQKLCLFGEY